MVQQELPPPGGFKKAPEIKSLPKGIPWGGLWLISFSIMGYGFYSYYQSQRVRRPIQQARKDERQAVFDDLQQFTAHRTFAYDLQHNTEWLERVNSLTQFAENKTRQFEEQIRNGTIR